MTYLEEFRLLLQEEKLAGFLRLWEEYCMTDQVDGDEIKTILSLVKQSAAVAPTFGQVTETVLPLWKQLEDKQAACDVLRLILDLQTTNSTLLAELAVDFLKKNYGRDPNFNQKLRIVGLLTRQQFGGAISNFELLSHMEAGKFVFHTGGWGVGEVVQMSLLREHVLLEFEGTSAIKDLSFESAFKNLIPLPVDHFLSRRFGDPDALAKEDALALIHLLLRDLGPKTAQEIKEELMGVIPEEEWSRWWQALRVRLKRDTKIHCPASAKEPFKLNLTEVTHEVKLKAALKAAQGLDAEILVIYNFLRDFPEAFKQPEMKLDAKQCLLEALHPDERFPDQQKARLIQALFLLEDLFPEEYATAISKQIAALEGIERMMPLIEIIAFKKRLLQEVRTTAEWREVFLHLLFASLPNPIRDYIFKELSADAQAKPLLKEKLYELLNKMTLYPEAFFWYFQKITAKEDVPYSDPEGGEQFLEALLILIHFLEDKPHLRELVKKIYQHLTAGRYAHIRQLIKGASIEYLQEFLLLASKCQSFTKHDIKILHSLAEVVQPALGQKKEPRLEQIEIIWTTQEGYQKLQERLHHIGTVETVDNAREIEAARALGDLRENAEYKFALERRSRLQAELRSLSRQLNQVRILTKNDVTTDEVGVGTIVHLTDSKGKKFHYTLLGPWDADPDQQILSFQSKFVQGMLGCRKGETFEFQGEKYTIREIANYFNE